MGGKQAIPLTGYKAISIAGRRAVLILLFTISLQSVKAALANAA
jgi:hypothetical protein